VRKCGRTVIVPLPEAALEFENRAIGRGGEHTLCEAYEILLREWRSGVRERELGLHLAFIAWYMLLEPPSLTGLEETRILSSSLPEVFREVHDYFVPQQQCDDAEVLYVFGLMAHLFPWVLGDGKAWEARRRDYRVAYRRLEPEGLRPEVFASRGFYGAYFAGQAHLKDGY
jgi:hypothetical protein